MIEATIYYYENDSWSTRTSNFPFRTESSLKRHLTSIYGSDNMENVFWDIIEPEEEEGLEEVEVLDSTVGKYLKKKARNKS